MHRLLSHRSVLLAALALAGALALRAAETAEPRVLTTAAEVRALPAAASCAR
jgi:hypothetical protein